MMLKTAKYLLYVILPLLTGSISYGQDMKFSGFVADSISHSPVVGAVVIISGLKDTLYTTTNDEGGFVFLNAPEDSVTFEISHISYSTFKIRTILASGQPELFFIERSSTALNSAVVTGSIPLFNFN